MISAQKKALIHIAVSELSARVGFTDDDYRSILHDEAHVKSSRDLDDAGFDRVMKRFEKLGFVSTARAARKTRKTLPKNVVGLATPRQKWLIDQQYQKL